MAEGRKARRRWTKVYPTHLAKPEGWATFLDVKPDWIRICQGRTSICPESIVALDPEAMRYLVKMWLEVGGTLAG